MCLAHLHTCVAYIACHGMLHGQEYVLKWRDAEALKGTREEIAVPFEMGLPTWPANVEGIKGIKYIRVFHRSLRRVPKSLSNFSIYNVRIEIRILDRIRILKTECFPLSFLFQLVSCLILSFNIEFSDLCVCVFSYSGCILF